MRRFRCWWRTEVVAGAEERGDGQVKSSRWGRPRFTTDRVRSHHDLSGVESPPHSSFSSNVGERAHFTTLCHRLPCPAKFLEVCEVFVNVAVHVHTLLDQSTRFTEGVGISLEIRLCSYYRQRQGVPASPIHTCTVLMSTIVCANSMSEKD